MHIRDCHTRNVERSRWTVLDYLDWKTVGMKLSLSQRELEVVQRIVSGQKLDSIANELVLGLGTVKTYAARVRGKVGVHDHVGLVLAVFEAGLLRRAVVSTVRMTHV